MFDDIIKNKANSHEAPVPPDAWNNIIRQKKKRRFGFFWWSSLLILLCTLGTGGYLLYKKSNPSFERAARSQSAAKENADPEIAGQPNAENKQAKIQLPTAVTNEPGNDTAPAMASTGKRGSSTLNSKKKMAVSTEKALPDMMNNGITSNQQEQTSREAGSTRRRKPVKKNSGGMVSSEQVTLQPDELNELTATSVPNHPSAEFPAQKAANSFAGSVADTMVNNSEKKQLGLQTVTQAGNDKNKATTTLNNHSKKHHWFIDAGIAPLLPLQHYDEHVVFNRTLLLNNNLSIFSGQLVSSSIDASMGFSLNIRRQLNQKWLIGTGLQYALLKENTEIKGHETHTQYNVVQRLVNGSTGPLLVNDTVAIVTEGTRNISAVNSYRLYSIPVFIQYSVVKKSGWNLLATGGLYFNISSTYQNEINRNAAAPLLNSNTNTTNTNTGYDFFAGLRIGKAVGRRLEFFSMPTMRWSLGNYAIKNSLLSKKIDQAGLSVGISYKIK